MLKNDKQLTTTLGWIDRFRDSIRAHDEAGVPAGVDPALHRAARDGMVSQVSDLEAQVRDYRARVDEDAVFPS